MEIAVGGSSAMAQLQEDFGTFVMNRFRDFLPGFALLVGVDSRSIDPPDGLSCNKGSFCNKKAC
jgi:hypothetical protein